MPALRSSRRADAEDLTRTCEASPRRRRSRLPLPLLMMFLVAIINVCSYVRKNLRYPQAPLSVASSSAQLYRQLLWLGRENDDNSNYHYTEDDRVPGCVSRVYVACNWMQERPDDHEEASYQPQQHLHYSVLAKDSPLTRGLAKLLTSKFNGKTPEEILSVDGEELVEHYGLGHSLTPQRTNGFVSMIRHMQRQAYEKREERQHRQLRGTRRS